MLEVCASTYQSPHYPRDAKFSPFFDRMVLTQVTQSAYSTEIVVFRPLSGVLNVPLPNVDT